MKRLKQQIIDRIETLGKGSVFTAKEFLSLTPRGTTDVVLVRLVKEGKIRRLGRGLFDYPRYNPSLGGKLSPDFDRVAQAIARKFRWTIIPEAALSGVIARRFVEA